jgi:poly(3-hydroxyalkanoate) depolymerase
MLASIADPVVRRPDVTHQLTVRGLTLRLVVSPGSDDKPPLLLMNGIGASLESLQRFVDHLNPEREVIRFDAPGVGRSPVPSHPYRLRGLCRSLAAALTELGYEKVDVLGISWGGALAQQFARSEGNRCRRLVLVSTSSGMVMFPGHPRVLSKMATHKRYTDPLFLEKFAHVLYGGSIRDDPEPALAALRSSEVPHSSRGYLMQLYAALGWTSFPFLPLIRQRTLVLSGHDDPLIPERNAKLLATMICRSELDIFQGGHLSMITEADDHAPRIEKFLDSQL